MKSDLLEQLNRAHQRLLKAIELLPNEGIVSGEWGKKQIISHIAGWYQEGIEATYKILNGEKPKSFRYSIDGFNKLSIKERKDMSLIEVTKQMQELHKDFVNLISDLTEKQIITFYGTTLGKKPINMLWMINEAISHDNGHAKEIEKQFQK